MHPWKVICSEQSCPCLRLIRCIWYPIHSKERSMNYRSNGLLLITAVPEISRTYPDKVNPRAWHADMHIKVCANCKYWYQLVMVLMLNVQGSYATHNTFMLVIQICTRNTGVEIHIFFNITSLAWKHFRMQKRWLLWTCVSYDSPMLWYWCSYMYDGESVQLRRTSKLPCFQCQTVR